VFETFPEGSDWKLMSKYHALNGPIAEFTKVGHIVKVQERVNYYWQATGLHITPHYSLTEASAQFKKMQTSCTTHSINVTKIHSNYTTVE
jgi:hypothetical protein